ncbi:hypothetical protein BJY01DRAFT_205702 [Aspergillus pseudoustus]|uniref:Uncharacterized protein n=1 Tax=Aspergillus pseudoustus TaxID=1810923 RepID=A0ABR4KPQ6_9EURO
MPYRRCKRTQLVSSVLPGLLRRATARQSQCLELFPATPKVDVDLRGTMACCSSCCVLCRVSLWMLEASRFCRHTINLRTKFLSM